jgi:hypothetical protein
LSPIKQTSILDAGETPLLKEQTEMDAQGADASRLRTSAIQNGRAMVKVIEGLQVLKRSSGSWSETLLINLTLSLYQHRLRQAIKVLPTEITVEILSASDSIGEWEILGKSRVSNPAPDEEHPL